MSDTFFPFAVQHIKVTYTYLDDTVASDSFSSGATNVSFTHTANSVSTIKAFYGLGTSVSPLSLIAPEDYVETTSGLTFHTPASKAGKVQYRYNAYTQVTETLDVTGLNLTLSHVPVSGYAIIVTSEDNLTTYVSGTDYTINALNSRIVELIPGGSIVQRTNSNYYYTMNGDGSSQFGAGGSGGGVAAVPDTYYDENDLPESIFVEYDTVTPVEDETGNATTVGEITSYTVSAFASGIDFRLVSVDELIVDGRTLAINEFSFNEKTGVVTLRETPTSLAIQISYTWRRHYGLVSLSLDSTGTGNLTVPASLVSTIKYPIVKTLETGGDTLLQYQDYVIEENLSSGIHKLVLLTDAIDGQVVVSEDGTAVYQTPVKLINKDEFNYDKLEDHHIVYRDGQLAISDEDPSRYVEYRDYDNEEYNSEWVERLTGSGTLADPYLIYTPYDFIVKVNSLPSNDGLYFKLMNNLDFGPVLGIKVSSVNGEIIAEEVDTTAPAYSQYGMGPIWDGDAYIFFDGNNKILKNIYSYQHNQHTGSIFCNSDLAGRITNLTIYHGYKGIDNGRSIGYIFNWTKEVGIEIKNVHIISSKIFKRSEGYGNYNMIGAIGGSAVGNVRLIDCSVIDSEIEVGNNDAAALIGGTYSNRSVISLTNCYSNSIVKSLAANNYTRNISGLCNISSTSTSYIPNCHFENCYFGGQIIYNTLSEEGSGWPIIGGYNGSFSEYESIFVNCYSKSGSSKVQQYVTVKTDSEMKQPLFVNLLNTGLEEPAYVYNPGGYPKLLEEKIHPLSSNYRIPVLDSNGSVLYSTPYKLADLEKIPSISQAWKNHIEDELDNVFSPHALTYYTEDTLPNSIHADYDISASITNKEYNLTVNGYYSGDGEGEKGGLIKISNNFTLISVESIYTDTEQLIDPTTYTFTPSGLIISENNSQIEDIGTISYTYQTDDGVTHQIVNENAEGQGIVILFNGWNIYCYSVQASNNSVSNVTLSSITNLDGENTHWLLISDDFNDSLHIYHIEGYEDYEDDSGCPSVLLISYNISNSEYSVEVSLTNGTGPLYLPITSTSTVNNFSCKAADETVLRKYQDYYLTENSLVLLTDKYQGQVPVTTESSSAWINPALVVKNPYNLTNLEDHPVVYKDSELVYRNETFANYPNNAAYYANIPFPESILVYMKCTIDATESGTVTTVDNVSTYIVTGYTKTNLHRNDWKLLAVSNLRVGNQYVEYTFTENGTITLNESVADGTAISLSYKYFWDIGNYPTSVDTDTGIVQLDTSDSSYMPTTVNNISLNYIVCQTTDYFGLIRNIDYTIKDTGTKQLQLLKTSIPNQIEATKAESNTDIKLCTIKQAINGYVSGQGNYVSNGKSVVFKNDELVYSNEACNNPEPYVYANIDPKASTFRFNLEYDLFGSIINESNSFSTSDNYIEYHTSINILNIEYYRITRLELAGIEPPINVLNDSDYSMTIEQINSSTVIKIYGLDFNSATGRLFLASGHIEIDYDYIIHNPKTICANSKYKYTTPDPRLPSGITCDISNVKCTTLSGQLLEIDQDYTVTRYSNSNRFIIEFIRKSLPGQILTRTEDGSTWKKPSLLIDNPDNISDLNNKPVIYKDSKLVYGNLPIQLATTDDIGLVQVGSNINISNGEISVSDATSSTKGVVSVGSNINVSNGEISVPAATASIKGVVAYDSNLFKTDTNDKLSLNTLIYRRSIRGVTESVSASGGKISVSITNAQFTPPSGYRFLTMTVRTNYAAALSFNQTTMQEDWTTGAVAVGFTNHDSSAHTYQYIIDLLFIKTDLFYHEYIDTRS